MPQLEQVEFFISQLFWLGVFFVILFSVLTYITLPKIRAFLNQRDDFVKSHISKQDELIKKAESIIENYEAKLTEAKNQASKIINDAKDKVLMGIERKSMVMKEEEKKLTAYHEAGHAIVAIHSKESDPVHKATIIPLSLIHI